MPATNQRSTPKGTKRKPRRGKRMSPKPTMGRGFTAGGRKGTTKKGNYSSYLNQYDSSASAHTGSSKASMSQFMSLARGPGMGAGRGGKKGGAHSSASAIGQRPPRPKEGRRGFVGGSNR